MYMDGRMDDSLFQYKFSYWCALFLQQWFRMFSEQFSSSRHKVHRCQGNLSSSQRLVLWPHSLIFAIPHQFQPQSVCGDAAH